jgi:integrase
MRRKDISDKHYESIVTWLKSDTSLDGLVLDILIRTGIRQSELVRLQAKNFDLERCMVEIKATKESENRQVPFAVALSGKLRFWFHELNGRTIGELLSRGDVMSQKRAVRRSVHQTLTLILGPHPYTAHSTRHTWAMRVFKQLKLSNPGLALMNLQMVMGHKSITSTLKYLRFLEIAEINPQIMEAIE